jgi:hypothetical protein
MTIRIAPKRQIIKVLIPWRPADLTPTPKKYLYRAGLVLKISSRSSHSIQSYLIFSRGQNNRCMPSH